MGNLSTLGFTRISLSLWPVLDRWQAAKQKTAADIANLVFLHGYRLEIESLIEPMFGSHVRSAGTLRHPDLINVPAQRAGHLWKVDRSPETDGSSGVYWHKRCR